ncbi:MAG TPA: hypothetical protein VIC29_03995 [Steroidobacteraceae bacterium]
MLPVGTALSDSLDEPADPAEPHALLAVATGAHDLADWQEWPLEELPPGAAALALRAPVATVRQSACPVLALPRRPRAL